MANENTHIAQGCTLWEERIRRPTRQLFGGFDTSYLQTGQPGIRGDARNAWNICKAHINQMPFGQSFIESLGLPDGFWSSLQIEKTITCKGCNRSERALGLVIPRYSNHEVSGSEPILKGFGMHCASKVAIMTYWAEILGMWEFNHIRAEVARNAIDVALRNGTAYAEYCEQMRQYLTKERPTQPTPPTTEPYPVVPCLTIEERRRYWFPYMYDNLIDKTFTFKNQLFRVDAIVPVGKDKMNCFKVVDAATDEEQGNWSWKQVTNWMTRSGSTMFRSASTRRPPRERTVPTHRFDNVQSNSDSDSDSDSDAYVPRKKRRVDMSSDESEEESEDESQSEEEAEWISEEDTDEDEPYDSDISDTSEDGTHVSLRTTKTTRPTRSTRRVVSYAEDINLELDDDSVDEHCSM